jgi:amino acid transporter
MAKVNSGLPLGVSRYFPVIFARSNGLPELILIFIVFAFTFITMVGGNPQHDAYGFRYWKTPVS